MEKLLFAAIQMETSQNECCRAFPLNHRASQEPLSKTMPSGKLSPALPCVAAPPRQHSRTQSLLGPVPTGAAPFLRRNSYGTPSTQVSHELLLSPATPCRVLGGSGVMAPPSLGTSPGWRLPRQYSLPSRPANCLFSLPSGCPSPFPWLK